jgi:hypothetical protein
MSSQRDVENAEIMQYLRSVFAPREYNMSSYRHIALRDLILYFMEDETGEEVIRNENRSFGEHSNPTRHSAINSYLFRYIEEVLSRDPPSSNDQWLRERILEDMRIDQGQQAEPNLHITATSRTSLNNASPVGHVTVNPNNIPPTERWSPRGGRRRGLRSRRRRRVARGKKTRRY